MRERTAADIVARRLRDEMAFLKPLRRWYRRRQWAYRVRKATKPAWLTRTTGIAFLLVAAGGIGAVGAWLYDLASQVALKPMVTAPSPVIRPEAPEPRFSAKGMATVVDGDTLRIDGRRIRLANFDAPELSDAGGTRARDVLRELVAGKVVECRGTTLDRWQRIVALCTIHGVDLGESLRVRGVIEQRRDGRPILR